MLIIKFAVWGCKYTWYIHENWAMFISFLLTMIVGISFRKIRNIIKNSCSEEKKIKMINGAFFDECIHPDSVYEVVDPRLEIVIKRMLKIPSTGDTVIISGEVWEVLIMAYFGRRQF